ncbi:ribosome maturation factor RimP [Falsarthrobacter nasiphocae]|uniref:Ribosome maturation factor RimP n=1 Tax=Falsarthrobacter nasiphocae TaxID=189863 RepID=A0AAE3YFU1_9MICC|nr:ribosome maturation factor RimP [Falsarthrobacter nasiphocae]MDR6892649.1 ribosome maturation factor RimP [Falsarthrobacter nasiphocae]
MDFERVVGVEDDAPQPSQAEAAVVAAVASAAHAHGAYLEDVSFRESGGHRLLQIAVDALENEDAPLDLDAVARISESISAALDAADPIGGEAYELEVSTPGLSRPLTHRHHFERSVGRWLTVKTADGVVEGRLNAVGPSQLEVQGELPAKKGVKPKAAEPQTIPFAEIRRAKINVDMSARDAQTEVEEA